MIIPAILQENLEDIEHELRVVSDFATVVQIDFADGRLVEGKSFLDLEKILNIELPQKKPVPNLDIHLMVKNPFPYIKQTNKRIKSISAHVEAEFNTKSWLQEVKNQGHETGISISPKTSWKTIEHLIPKIDYIQFLTVNPGLQGQKFQPEILNEIKAFRKEFPRKIIQADGGINESNILDVLKAGVDNVVIGSAILQKKNPEKAYKNFERIKNEYRKTL